MHVKGLQKLSLIEYPGKTSAVVFLAGCNLRCPFCQNPELVQKEQYDKMPDIPQKEVFSVLEQRRKWIDGVAITGGEPCINPGLPDFIRSIKSMGFAVCLETNGTNPEMLRQLIREELVDYIAMDIKAPPAKYQRASGSSEEALENVRASASILMNSNVDYEFRTTVVPGLHTESDIEEIAEWLDGAKRFCIQGFRPEKTLDPAFTKAPRASREQLRHAAGAAASHFKEIVVRD